MRDYRVVTRAAVAATVLLACGGEGWASCRLTGDQLGSAVENSFKREPRTLMLQYPHGEDGLRGVTLQMAAAGTDTLDAVVSIVALANNAQRQAIGRGLAAAVNACSKQDSALAKKIMQAAKGSGNSAVQRAFNMTLDTSDYDAGPRSPTATAAAVPDAGLKPGIGSSLVISKPKIQSGLPDPYGDPADWH